MGFTREALNNMLDIEIDSIYKNMKNDKLKLYKLKNGNYSVYYNGSNIFESPSLRVSKIEFILQCVRKGIGKNDSDSVDYLKNLFGFN